MGKNMILEKLQGVKARFEEVEKLISDPEVIADMERFIKLNKEYKDLQPIISSYNDYKNILSNIDNAKDILANEKDDELKEMAKVELDDLSEKIEPLEEVDEIRQDGHLFCQRFLLRIKETPHCIGAYLLDELRKYDTLLLHSYSSTVLKMLLYAKREGCSFSVICTESRPAYEGILLAKNLAANNINVTLVTDAAIGSMLPTVDCTIVGVDAITKEGIWNKTGTMGILLSSWTLHIPSYNLSGIEKILPERYSPTYRKRDPQELLSEPIDKLQPFNYYFDMTPWSYIQHIVTNEGPLSVSAIQKRMKALKLHQMFTSMVKT